MRTDQYIGLNKWATDLLAAQSQEMQVLTIAILPEGKGAKTLSNEMRMVPLYETEVIGGIESAFWPGDIVASLHKYTFPEGLVYEEFVQSTPWSSGPCYFIALKRPDGEVVEMSLWEDNEIMRVY